MRGVTFAERKSHLGRYPLTPHYSRHAGSAQIIMFSKKLGRSKCQIERDHLSRCFTRKSRFLIKCLREGTQKVFSFRSSLAARMRKGSSSTGATVKSARARIVATLEPARLHRLEMNRGSMLVAVGCCRQHWRRRWGGRVVAAVAAAVGEHYTARSTCKAV